jgi:hypothetical protein
MAVISLRVKAGASGDALPLLRGGGDHRAAATGLVHEGDGPVGARAEEAGRCRRPEKITTLPTVRLSVVVGVTAARWPAVFVMSID